MPPRNHPYGAFNYLVEIDAPTGGAGSPIVAGFSDVTGLGTEINYSDYREGSDARNGTRKVPNTYKTDEVTFKRGLTGDLQLFQWYRDTRDGQYLPRQIVVTLLDESRQNRVLTIELHEAQPKKWTGPTLAGKGGADVAIEEFKVVFEWLEYQAP